MATWTLHRKSWVCDFILSNYFVSDGLVLLFTKCTAVNNIMLLDFSNPQILNKY